MCGVERVIVAEDIPGKVGLATIYIESWNSNRNRKERQTMIRIVIIIIVTISIMLS